MIMIYAKHETLRVSLFGGREGKDVSLDSVNDWFLVTIQFIGQKESICKHTHINVDNKWQWNMRKFVYYKNLKLYFPTALISKHTHHDIHTAYSNWQCSKYSYTAIACMKPIRRQILQISAMYGNLYLSLTLL